MKLLLLFFAGLFLAVSVHAMDAPAGLAQVRGGDMNPSGLPGFYSTPARVADPGFGMNFYRMPSTDQMTAGLSGEFEVFRFRGAFSGSYESMDSVFRQINSGWDVSAGVDWLVLGAGYGLSINWIPEEEVWTNHRYKIGVTFVHENLSFSAMGWNYTSEPLKELLYLLGLYVKGGRSFEAYAQWDGVSAVIGTTLGFKYMSFSTAYRMPGFSVAVKLDFHLGQWSGAGIVGNSGHSLEWFGFEVERKIKKKTIL